MDLWIKYSTISDSKEFKGVDFAGNAMEYRNKYFQEWFNAKDISEKEYIDILKCESSRTIDEMSSMIKYAILTTYNVPISFELLYEFGDSDDFKAHRRLLMINGKDLEELIDFYSYHDSLQLEKIDKTNIQLYYSNNRFFRSKLALQLITILGFTSLTERNYVYIEIDYMINYVNSRIKSYKNAFDDRLKYIRNSDELVILLNKILKEFGLEIMSRYMMNNILKLRLEIINRELKESFGIQFPYFIPSNKNQVEKFIDPNYLLPLYDD